MIETVFLDWGLSFGAGVLFAIAGRREVRGATHRFRTRAFLTGLVYLHLGILAISLTLYALNRDWMWMYWVDPRTLPIGIVALAFVLYELCFVAGFTIAAEASGAIAWIVAGATFAAISTLEITARTRLFHFGTLDEFRAGRAVPAMRLAPFHIATEWWVAGVAGAASTIALVVLLVALWRRARLV